MDKSLHTLSRRAMGIAMLLYGILAASGVRAQTFTTGNITYKVTDASAATVSVTSATQVISNLSIPSSVVYDKKTYTVTEIGDKAFTKYKLTGTIKLPKTLKKIGEQAFCYADITGELYIPLSVESIGRNAFNGCKKLTSLRITHSVKELGNYAFDDCRGVTYLYFDIPDAEQIVSRRYPMFSHLGADGSGVDVVIGNHVKSIRQYTFSAYVNLKSLTFEAGSVCTEIDEGAFTDYNKEYGELSSLGGELRLPSSIKKIGAGAFAETSITSLVIPEGVKEIGAMAFQHCGKLARVEYNAVNATTPYYGNGSCFDYSGCNVGGFDLVIGSNVEVIGNGLFNMGYDEKMGPEWGVGGLKSLTLSTPCNLRTIGKDTFSGNSLLTGKIDIPPSVETIGDGAFSGCRLITDVVVPSTVTSVGIGAFGGCTNLSTFYYDVANNTAGYLFPSSEDYDPMTGGTIVMEHPFTLTLGPSVESLPNNFCWQGFVGTMDLSKATKLKSIGEYAFYQCSSLEGPNALAFGDALATVGSYAFYKCSSLRGPLRLPTSLVTDGKYTLGARAFEGVTVNEIYYDLDIRSKKKSDGSYENSDMNHLISSSRLHFEGKLTIGPSVVEIPNEMKFASGDYVIKQLEFATDSKLRRIGNNAFSSHPITGSINLPSSIEEIGSSAFAGTAISGTLQLPKSIKAIGGGAFSGCKELKGTIAFPSNLTDIGAGAFKGCAGLTGTLTIPATVSNLGWEAFFGANFDRLVIEDGDTPLTTGNNFSKTGGWIVKAPAIDSKKETADTDSEVITTDGTPDVGGPKRATAMSTLGLAQGMFSQMPLTEAYIGRELSYLCGAMADMSVVRNYYSPFNWSRHLERVVIGQNVKKTLPYQFAHCANLKSVVFPDGMETIADGTCYMDSVLVEVNVPRSVTIVGTGAFASCAALEHITIGSQTASEGKTMCMQAAADASTYGNTILDEGVFWGCEMLKSVNLTDAVSEIREDAFRWCTALTSLTCARATPPAIDTNAFRYAEPSACTLYVPIDCAASYRKNEVWGQFNVEEADLTGISSPSADVLPDADAERQRFDISGKRLHSPSKGINIIRKSDGSVRKVVVR